MNPTTTSAPASATPHPLAGHGARAVALALIAVATYWAAPRSGPILGSTRAETSDNVAALAARFRFVSCELPHPETCTGRWQSERAVHPSLDRIRAWISAVGAAVAMADLDGDGLANDLCHVDPRCDRVHVLPAPASGDRYAPFTLDVAPLPYDSATMAPMGCLPGDLNEDGRTDLLVYYWGRTPVAFMRTERGEYQPRELTPSGERWYTNAVTRADVDGDGHIDLIVGNYFPDGARILDAADNSGESEQMQASMSRAYNGGSQRIWLWRAASRSPVEPDVEFADTPYRVEPALPRAWTLAVGAADLSGDTLPEIYFANDFGPDRLLWNRSTPGQLRFALVEGREPLGAPSSCVIGRDSFKGMGIDFGDVNGDGHLDLYVSNIAAEFALEEGHFLFLSTGELDQFAAGRAPYADAAETLGLARSSWGWESRLEDFDNDGILEALQACGFLRGSRNGWPRLQELATANDSLLSDPRTWPEFVAGDDLCGNAHNPLFVRDGAGRYVDVANALGIATPQVSRGIATGDVDGDGDLDFAVANQWLPSRFYRNEAPHPGAYLGLRLLQPLEHGALRVEHGRPAAGKSLGYPAIGARAVVRRADGAQWVSEVDGGSGHSGECASELLFGVGKVAPTEPLSVELIWRDPSGAVRRSRQSLVPGWHTIVLEWPAGKAAQ